LTQVLEPVTSSTRTHRTLPTYSWFQTR